MKRKRGERVPPSKGGWHWANNSFIDQFAAEVGVNATGVYYVLCRTADENGQSHRSVSNMAQLLGLHSDTVRNALKKLEKHGLITKKPRREAGLNRTNIYTVLNFDSTRPRRVLPDQNDDHYEGSKNTTRREPKTVPDQTREEEEPSKVEPFEVDEEKGGNEIEELQKATRVALERVFSKEDRFVKTLRSGWTNSDQFDKSLVVDGLIKETGLPTAARRDIERFMDERVKSRQENGRVVTAGQVPGHGGGI